MSEGIHVYGLTGGVATGKSTCVNLLKELYKDIVIFDADECVARLYQTSAILLELRAYFGCSIFDNNDQLDKKKVRDQVFTSKDDLRFLEGLFHPRVREECLALLETTVKDSTSRLFVADVPLLFENGFDFGQSANLLVATSRQAQFNRFKKRNEWKDEILEAVLSSQIDISAKIKMADVVFWNEGGLLTLKSQCKRFIQSLNL